MTNLREWGAEYQCIACGHEWIGWCGPGAVEEDEPPLACQTCGSIYVKWANYEEMFG